MWCHRIICTHFWRNACCYTKNHWRCPHIMSFMKLWRSIFRSKCYIPGIPSQRVISDWKIQVRITLVFNHEHDIEWNKMFCIGRHGENARRIFSMFRTISSINGKLINFISLIVPIHFVCVSSDPESSRHINSTIKTNRAITWSEKTILIRYDVTMQQQPWKSAYGAANVRVARMAHRHGIHSSEE